MDERRRSILHSHGGQEHAQGLFQRLARVNELTLLAFGFLLEHGLAPHSIAWILWTDGLVSLTASMVDLRNGLTSSVKLTSARL